MDIDYLREYVTFCKYLNYASASKELMMAPSTLNRHIHAVEDEFGCTLVRQMDPVSLTPAGSFVLEHTSSLLSDYEALLTGARQRSGLMATQIRVAYYHRDRAFIDILEQASFDLDAAGRPVQTQYVEITKGTTWDAVKSGKVDMAITYHAEPDDDIYMSEPIFGDKTVVAVHVDDPLAKSDAIDLASLSDLSIIWPAGKPLEDWLECYFRPFCTAHNVKLNVERIFAASTDDFYTINKPRSAFLLSQSETVEYLSFMPMPFRRTRKILQLRDVDGTYTVYAFRRKDASATVVAFIKAMQQAARDQGRATASDKDDRG